MLTRTNMLPDAWQHVDGELALAGKVAQEQKSGSGFEQAKFQRPAERFGAAGYAELLVNVCQMKSHRALADVKLPRNLFIAQTVCQGTQHFRFARRQQAGGVCLRRSCQAINQLA